MPKCEVLGERDKSKVSAITDALGSHVVVEGRKHCLHKCASHKAAVLLGKKVIKHGFDVCQWEQPIGTLIDLAFAMENNFSRKLK